jgi:hypothetical protein
MTYKEQIFEDSPRIQHLEDLIFWDGKKGATIALKTLNRVIHSKHNETTTVKWDGSPAIMFGRNERGEFVLTDKSGFSAKGYDGKATSGDMLMNIMLSRGKKAPDAGRKAFAIKMKQLFNVVETSVPADFRGYFKGDLLYFTTPPMEDGRLVFTPNIVTYSVDASSELGTRIQASEAGVVVHKQTDTEGNEVAMTALGELESGAFMIFPPITTQAPAEVGERQLNALQNKIQKYGPAIDKMLNKNTLRDLRIMDLPAIFYTYTNQQVDAEMLDHLGGNFLTWLESSKVSAAKQIKLLDYLRTHRLAFKGMWEIVRYIMAIKDKVIGHFDDQELDITQHINGQKGGEGYVHTHPQHGDIKFVPRSTFSAANRASTR